MKNLTEIDTDILLELLAYSNDDCWTEITMELEDRGEPQRIQLIK